MPSVHIGKSAYHPRSPPSRCYAIARRSTEALHDWIEATCRIASVTAIRVDPQRHSCEGRNSPAHRGPGEEVARLAAHCVTVGDLIDDAGTP
jgi:hypothetical protein